MYEPKHRSWHACCCEMHDYIYLAVYLDHACVTVTVPMMQGQIWITCRPKAHSLSQLV